MASVASVASMASIAYRNSFATQSFRKRKWQHLLPLSLLFFFFFQKKSYFFLLLFQILLSLHPIF